jgi:hypothetical protein
MSIQQRMNVSIQTVPAPPPGPPPPDPPALQPPPVPVGSQSPTISQYFQRQCLWILVALMSSAALGVGLGYMVSNIPLVASAVGSMFMVAVVFLINHMNIRTNASRDKVQYVLASLVWASILAFFLAVGPTTSAMSPLQFVYLVVPAGLTIALVVRWVTANAQYLKL